MAWGCWGSIVTRRRNRLNGPVSRNMAKARSWSCEQLRQLSAIHPDREFSFTRDPAKLPTEAAILQERHTIAYAH